jgi:hypothetical protein
MSRFRPAHPKPAASFSPAIKNWLSQATEIEIWWPSLERQSALQAAVGYFCQKQRCNLPLVRELDTSILALLAKSPSQAAKLRNLQTSILQHLAQQGWYFSRIVVRVQPEPFSRPLPRPPVHKAALPENSLEHWQKRRVKNPPQ